MSIALMSDAERNNIEDERWAAHSKAHARDQEVADKAAKDVKEALDKAAIEVTGRLTEVRAYIDQVLTSHADLHEADRVALLLARTGLDKDLKEINNVREQIAAERSQYATGDLIRTLLQGLKQEMISLITTRDIDARTESSSLALSHKENSQRITVLETQFANLNGKLAMFSGSVVVGVGLLEFFIRSVKIG